MAAVARTVATRAAIENFIVEEGVEEERAKRKVAGVVGVGTTGRGEGTEGRDPLFIAPRPSK